MRVFSSGIAVEWEMAVFVATGMWMGAEKLLYVGNVSLKLGVLRPLLSKK